MSQLVASEASASGYGAEATRIGTDVLFGRKSPADAAQDLLAVIEGSR